MIVGIIVAGLVLIPCVIAANVLIWTTPLDADIWTEDFIEEHETSLP